MGFLYLRYVCDPRKLWNWFHKYLRDAEVWQLEVVFGCVCWRDFLPLVHARTLPYLA